jgi:RNA polymerase sigma-70 factor, ECF subfamily
MVPISERDLLKGAKSFDPASLGAVYDQYSPGIYRYAMRLLGDECLAEDCVSETFSRFLKVLNSGQGPNEHLQAYLYRIAHNWITDSYRKKAPALIELDESFPADEDLGPANEAEISFQKREVREALQRLTPDQRQVIQLRFIEGLGNEEVAAALGKPISAIKTLQHRALGTLKRLLLQRKKEKSDERER